MSKFTVALGRALQEQTQKVRALEKLRDELMVQIETLGIQCDALESELESYRSEPHRPWL